MITSSPGSDTQKQAQSLKIRCPHCFQVFKTFRHEFEEEYPDFCCSVCQGEFWIDSVAARAGGIAQGYPPSAVKIPSHTVRTMGRESYKMCPRCLHKCKLGDTECVYCGVVFEKWARQNPEEVRLRSLWELVLKQWQNHQSHNDFISTCHSQNKLIYGMSCYGRILKEDSKNTKAKEMIGRMKALLFPYEVELRWRDGFVYRIKKLLKYYSHREFLIRAGFVCMLLGLLWLLF